MIDSQKETEGDKDKEKERKHNDDRNEEKRRKGLFYTDVHSCELVGVFFAKITS